MRKNRHLKQVASAVLAMMLAAVPASASVITTPDGTVAQGSDQTDATPAAQEDTVLDYDGSRTGKITIDYRSKDDTGTPVKGAVFHYYKIADLVTDMGGAEGGSSSAGSGDEKSADGSTSAAAQVDAGSETAAAARTDADAGTDGTTTDTHDTSTDGTASSGALSEAYTGSHYQSVIDGITVSGDTMAEDIEEAVLSAYKDVDVPTGTTDENGRATTELAPGAYMGVEVKPEIGYLPSDAFLFAVPEGHVNGDVVDGWNYHVTVYPKVAPVSLGTTLTWNGIHEAAEEESGSFVDRVRVTGLVKGRTYHLRGRLYNADTKEALDSTSTLDFTAESTTEVRDLSFTLSTKDQAGKRIVAFEDLYVDQITKDTKNPGADENDEWTKKDQTLVHTATHHDFGDKSQTVNIVKIGTTLTTTDGLHELDEKSTTLVDSVLCTGLIKDHRYKISGVLMDADAKTSTGMTAERTFTAAGSKVIVRVNFKGLDLTKWNGKRLVAFESLYDVEGKDTGENGKTDSTPSGTDSSTSGTTDSNGGKTDSGTTSSTTSTPSESGTTSTDSTSSTPSGNGGKNGGETLITKHEDFNDQNQTVHVVEIGTTLTGPDSAKTLTNTTTTLTDTVVCKGLIPGRKYLLTGELMSKAKNASTGITGKAEFTAKATEQTVTVEFKNADLSSFSDDSLVAFETLYGYKISTDGLPGGKTESTPNTPNGNNGNSTPSGNTPNGGQDRYEVTTHKNINDEAQTVTVKKPNESTHPGGNGNIPPVKTSDTVKGILYLAVVAVAAVVLVLAIRKKGKNPSENGKDGGKKN